MNKSCWFQPYRYGKSVLMVWLKSTELARSSWYVNINLHTQVVVNTNIKSEQEYILVRLGRAVHSHFLQFEFPASICIVSISIPVMLSIHHYLHHFDKIGNLAFNNPNRGIIQNTLHQSQHIKSRIMSLIALRDCIHNPIEIQKSKLIQYYELSVP